MDRLAIFFVIAVGACVVGCAIYTVSVLGLVVGALLVALGVAELLAIEESEEVA